ncbi:MAG: gliding motility-associated C-terminal domain-containing protein [Cytophagaceae bacterium]
MRILSTLLLALSLCLSTKLVQAQYVSLYDGGATPISTHNSIVEAYGNCSLSTKHYTIAINSSYPESGIGCEFNNPGLTLGNNNAASVTIKLNTGVAPKTFLKSSASNRAITLNGAKNLTIDGSLSTGNAVGGINFDNGGSTGEVFIEIKGASNNITIKYCTIKPNLSGPITPGVILMSDGGNNNINILNNIIDSKTTSNFYRAAIHSTSGATENYNINIQGNTFSNYSESAIKAISNNNAMTNWTVQNNTFNMKSSLTISSATYHDVVFIGGGSGHQVLGNSFGGNGATGNYTVTLSNTSTGFNYINFGSNTSGTITLTGNVFYRTSLTGNATYNLNVNMMFLNGNAEYVVGGTGLLRNYFGSSSATVTDGLIFNFASNSNVCMIKNLSKGKVTIENNMFNNINCSNSFITTMIDNFNTGTAAEITITDNKFGTDNNGTSVGIKPYSSASMKTLYLVHANTSSVITIHKNSVTNIGAINEEGKCFYVEAAPSTSITDNVVYNITIPATGTSPSIKMLHVSVTGQATINSNNFFNIMVPHELTGIEVSASASTECKDNIFGMNGQTGAPIQGGYFQGININAAESTTPRITIQTNTIKNVTSTGTTGSIAILANKSANITSNVIDNLTTNVWCSGIFMYGGGNCSLNQMSNITTSDNASNDIRGISINYYVTSGASLLVSQNIVQNLKISNNINTNSKVLGIELSISQPCPSVSIINNFIDLKQVVNYGLLGFSCYANSISVLNVYHNTILLRASGYAASSDATCLKVSGTISSANVKNNIFYNDSDNTGSPGTAKSSTEDYSNLTITPSTNNNYLFSKRTVGFGIWTDGTAVGTLAAWKTTASCSNSLGGSGGTGAVTFSSTDEKPTGYFPGAGKGANESVSIDRFNSPRSSTFPWIGSYEGFQIETKDITPTSLCSGQQLTLEVIKTGNYPASSTYQVLMSASNGVFPATPNVIVTGSPTTGNTITFTVPNVSGTGYKFKVKTTITAMANEVSAYNGPAVTISTAPIANPVTTTASCSNNAFTINLTSSTTGTVYSWTRDAVSGITPATSSSTAPLGTSIKDTLASANTANTIVTYVVTPIYNGCSGTPINITKTIIKTAITPSQNDLPQAILDESYSSGSAFTVSPSNSNPPQATYTLVTGSFLPDGLNYYAATKTITGKPTQTGTFSFTIEANDNGCITSQTYGLTVRNLFNPNLKFTPAAVDKTYGDDPFIIPVTSRSDGNITYSLSTTTAATINPNTGKITIQNATPNSFIWVYASQDRTVLYRASKDSVRLFIRKATPKIILTSSTAYALAQPRPLTYFLTKGYPQNAPPTDPIFSQQPAIAVVSADADSIYPLSEGVFNILFSFPELSNYNAFDSVLTFTVYEEGVPPVAVTDTLYVIRNTDGTFTVDTINIITNDTSKTGLIKYSLTDIDEDNVGSQYLYFKPSIGTFVFDTLTGKLSMNPYVGLKGSNFIYYSVTDEDGLFSTSAKIVIIVTDQAETPPLKGNEIMTPNGDGTNDALVIGYTDVSQPNNIMIFDVAGNTLYQSDNYQNDWTGKDKNGKDLESGIYFYVFKEKTGSQRELTGYVKITR